MNLKKILMKLDKQDKRFIAILIAVVVFVGAMVTVAYIEYDKEKADRVRINSAL